MQTASPSKNKEVNKGEEYEGIDCMSHGECGDSHLQQKLIDSLPFLGDASMAGELIMFIFIFWDFVIGYIQT